ncbi:ATP-binding cassette domain-containing protein [Nonomuraea sp. NPDC051941]|uniref:ATP-binding cassette domain-containing protein n=1 Tax=Nonomuraea sp. NPDC051941 TaxID=3364373 RepID=UPI0037C5CA28
MHDPGRGINQGIPLATHLPAARFETSLKKVRDLLGLDEFLDTPVRQLSLGQRMRGDLAAAVLYEPPLLYLDEPTVGLDVVAKEAVREFIVETNRAGRTTVILTTHDLADVEALCKRIILIDHGRVLFDGAIDALVNQPRRLVVLLESGPEEVRGVPRDAEGRYVFEIHDDLPGMIASISAEHTIRDLSIEEPDLESVIKGIYTSSTTTRASAIELRPESRFQAAPSHRSGPNTS